MEGRILDVTIELSGTSLLEDAAVGATTLLVEDISDFTDEGGELVVNGVIMQYLTVDEELESITLAVGLAEALDADAESVRVDVYPTTAEKWAMVFLTDTEDMTLARVPHSLYDRLEDGIRDPEDQELAVVEQEGTDWVVSDIIAQIPVIDGSYIDPDTIVLPPESDGLAPDYSPTPTVIGGLGSIFLRWGAVPNADPVSYSVYASVTSPVTVDPANLVDTVGGTMLNVRALPGGGTIPYDVDTFFAIVASDMDGAAPISPTVAGRPVRINSPDIAAGSVVTESLAAGAVTAVSLASVLVLGSTITTAESGRRVVLNEEGLVLKSQSDETLASFPTDPNVNPFIKGNLEADSLTVNNHLSIKGMQNEISANSSVVIAGSITDPTATPVPVIDYENFPSWMEQNEDSFEHRGLAFDGTAFCTVGTFFGPFIRRMAEGNGGYSGQSDGVGIPSATTGEWFGLGVTYIAGRYYTLCKHYTGNYKVFVSTIDWVTQVATLVDSWVYSYNDSAPGTPQIGKDAAGKVLISKCPGDGRIVVHKYEPNGAPLGTVLNVASSAGPFDFSVMSVGLYTFDHDGASLTRYVISSSIAIYVFTETSIRQPNYEWPKAGGGGSRGMELRSGQWQSMDASWHLTRYSGITWTTANPVWEGGFTWRDSDVGGTGVHESMISESVSFTMKKRARLSLTSPKIPDSGNPDDPNSVRFYLRRTGSGDSGGFRLNGSPAAGVTTHRMTSVGWSTALSPASNNFPGGADGEISSAVGGFVVRGDGTGAWPSLFPAGVVSEFAGSVLPDGHLWCDGAAVSRTVYARLFNAIGTTFGTGDGSTTFNLPDRRRRFGMGQGGVTNLGANEGYLLNDRSPNHQHSSGTLSAEAGSLTVQRNSATPANTTSHPSHTHNVVGTTGYTNTGFPYLAMNYIIRI